MSHGNFCDIMLWRNNNFKCITEHSINIYRLEIILCILSKIKFIMTSNQACVIIFLNCNYFNFHFKPIAAFNNNRFVQCKYRNDESVSVLLKTRLRQPSALRRTIIVFVLLNSAYYVEPSIYIAFTSASSRLYVWILLLFIIN